MKRIALFASLLAMAAGPAFSQSVSIDAKTLETLQARIAALESRVRDLESGNPSKSPASAPLSQNESKKKAAPSTPPSAPLNQKAPQRKYTIQEGDTVSEIARKHGIPRMAFMEANNIREGQQIYIGDDVIIPSPPASQKSDAKGTQVAENKSAPAGNSGGSFKTYTIKYGDTLSSIAREHKVSVAAIKKANGMSSDHISGGQKLKIPSGNGSVASNTTPSKPADKDEAKSGGTTPPSGSGELLRPEETYGLYTVEKGDTLFSLARDFFTSENELQRLNEMGKSTVLRPGKDMVVPTSKYFHHHKLAGN